MKIRNKPESPNNRNIFHWDLLPAIILINTIFTLGNTFHTKTFHRNIKRGNMFLSIFIFQSRFLWKPVFCSQPLSKEIRVISALLQCLIKQWFFVFGFGSYFIICKAPKDKMFFQLWQNFGKNFLLDATIKILYRIPSVVVDIYFLEYVSWFSSLCFS